MVKDPLTKWEGPFPYDALASVGITPNSTMQEVMDASFELMAQGLMTSEVRGAWDELRLTQNRLMVDCFLYQFEPHDKMNEALEHLNEQLTELAAVQDMSHLRQVDLDDLNQMQQDEREISLRAVEVRFMPEFEGKPPLPNVDFIQFDM